VKMEISAIQAQGRSSESEAGSAFGPEGLDFSGYSEDAVEFDAERAETNVMSPAQIRTMMVPDQTDDDATTSDAEAVSSGTRSSLKRSFTVLFALGGLVLAGGLVALIVLMRARERAA